MKLCDHKIQTPSVMYLYFRKLGSVLPDRNQFEFGTEHSNDDIPKRKLTKEVAEAVSSLSTNGTSLSEKDFQELLRSLTPERCIISYSTQKFRKKFQEHPDQWDIEPGTGAVYKVTKLSGRTLHELSSSDPKMDGLFDWPTPPQHTDGIQSSHPESSPIPLVRSIFRAWTCLCRRSLSPPE